MSALTRIGPPPAAAIVRDRMAELDRSAEGHEPEDAHTLVVTGFD